MRRIGVLMASAADDSEHQARMAAFLQGLAQLGWNDGRNVHPLRQPLSRCGSPAVLGQMGQSCLVLGRGPPRCSFVLRSR
jgi:hypothetical protein